MQSSEAVGIQPYRTDHYNNNNAILFCYNYETRTYMEWKLCQRLTRSTGSILFKVDGSPLSVGGLVVSEGELLAGCMSR